MGSFDSFNQISVERDRFKRIGQRDILPASVKSSKLQGFVFGSDTASASAAMNNGDNVEVSVSISQNSGYELLAINYLAVYVGSITAANQLFPTEGASQSITAWQISGPAYDWHTWNSNNFPASKDYMTLNIENVSAGSVTIYLQSKWKYISPQER